MVIRKVLNSSVVLVQDEGGEESILLARGSVMAAARASLLTASPRTGSLSLFPTPTLSP